MTQTVQESPKPDARKPGMIDLFGPPNLFQMESKRVIGDKLMKIWWDNPAEKITVEIAKEKLVELKLGKIDAEHIEEVVQTLNDKGLINKKLFNLQRTKKNIFGFWSFLFSSILQLTYYVHAWKSVDYHDSCFFDDF